MRRLSFVLIALFVCLFAATAFAQDWRAEPSMAGRISGIVTDASGKPIQGAKVKLSHNRGTPPPLTTNKNGKWELAGIMPGTWTVEVEAPGYVTNKQTADVPPVKPRPPVKSVMEPVPPPVEQIPQQTELANTVPPEAVDAVRKGENLMKQAEGVPIEGEITMSGVPGQQLTPEQKKELYKQAVAEFEKAQALLPDNLQLKQALAQAYYKAGNLKQAVALLQQVYDAEPTNNGVLLLLVNLLLENGQLAEGKALLDKVPAGLMTDPTALINLGILFMNKNKLDDAWTYFDKAVTLDPNRGETYYYRGLASLQKQKMAEAKADFQKVVQLAPDSSEANDAKELLKQMK